MTDGTKKTIIWETNTEPPKNYIWIKDDNKAYEFINGAWIESPTIIPVVSGKSYVTLEEGTFTENKTYNAKNGKAYSKVVVNVPTQTAE